MLMIVVLAGHGAPALGFGECPTSSKPGTGAPVPGPTPHIVTRPSFHGAFSFLRDPM